MFCYGCQANSKEPFWFDSEEFKCHESKEKSAKCIKPENDMEFFGWFSLYDYSCHSPNVFWRNW